MNTKQLIKLLIFLPVLGFSAGLVGMNFSQMKGTYLNALPKEFQGHLSTMVDHDYYDSKEEQIINDSVTLLTKAFEQKDKKLIVEFTKSCAYYPNDLVKDTKVRRKIFIKLAENNVRSIFYSPFIPSSRIGSSFIIDENLLDKLSEELKEFIGFRYILFGQDYIENNNNSLLLFKAINQKEDFDSCPLLSEEYTFDLTELIPDLIEFGCPIDATNNNDTPLSYAASIGNTKAIELLLQNCPIGKYQSKSAKIQGLVNTQSNGEGMTPLMRAAENGHHQIVVDLIEKKGAEIHLKSKDGKTALIYAAKNGHTTIVAYLLQMSKETNFVNWVDKNNMTSLIYAALGNHLDTVEYLANKTKNINNCNTVRKNALSYAIENNNLAMQELLKAKGAKEPVATPTPIIAPTPIVAATRIIAPTPGAAATPFWSKVKNWFSNSRNQDYTTAAVITTVIALGALQFGSPFKQKINRNNLFTTTKVCTHAILPSVGSLAQKAHAIYHSIKTNPKSAFAAGMIAGPSLLIVGLFGSPAITTTIENSLRYLHHKWNIFSRNYPRAARNTKIGTGCFAGLSAAAFAVYKIYTGLK